VNDYNNQNVDNLQAKILRNVAEDLKTPLTRIFYSAEYNRLNKIIDDGLIEVSAKTAIDIIDSYIYSSQLEYSNCQLKLEPVSLSVAISDAVFRLKNFAKFENCYLETKYPTPKSNLVMAQKSALETAIWSLCYSFILASDQSSGNKLSQIQLFTKIKKGGILVSLFGSNVSVGIDELNRARSLIGESRNLITGLRFGTSAGIVVADRLLNAMGSSLISVKEDGKRGLGTILLPSKQISLLG
jgi:K+-sensing histidine kinase KdpD